MASISIRKLDDDVKTRCGYERPSIAGRWRKRCAFLLRGAVWHGTEPRKLASTIRARTAPCGGVDLELPPREPPPFA